MTTIAINAKPLATDTVCVCVCVCARACVCACLRACVRVRVCVIMTYIRVVSWYRDSGLLRILLSTVQGTARRNEATNISGIIHWSRKTVIIPHDITQPLGQH